MDTRPSAALRHLVLAWITITFVFAWLPLLRSIMDGKSYQWGTRYFDIQLSGAGLAGDLWFLVGKTALGVWLLFRGWRDASSPFAAVLLGWLGVAAADSVYPLVTAPEAYRFEGATLGVDVSMAVVAPVLNVGFFLLGLLWAARGRPARGTEIRPAWTTTNAALLVLVVLLFPVQFLLLREGRGQEASDVVGVLLTIAQWILLSAALYPWRRGRPFGMASAAPERASA